MSFYRRDCSPSKHKNFLCIVTNKGFFLWWWDDCTWSSLSPTLKAVTSKIKHKKGLVYWPCLPLQKSTATAVFYLKPGTSVFSEWGLSQTSVLEAQISLITSLVWLWTCFRNVRWTVCCWKGEPERWNACFSFMKNFPLIHCFDAVNRIWWENSYIVYIALLLYINVPLAMAG